MLQVVVHFFVFAQKRDDHNQAQRQGNQKREQIGENIAENTASVVKYPAFPVLRNAGRINVTFRFVEDGAKNGFVYVQTKGGVIASLEDQICLELRALQVVGETQIEVLRGHEQINFALLKRGKSLFVGRIRNGVHALGEPRKKDFLIRRARDQTDFGVEHLVDVYVGLIGPGEHRIIVHIVRLVAPEEATLTGSRLQQFRDKRKTPGLKAFKKFQPGLIQIVLRFKH